MSQTIEITCNRCGIDIFNPIEGYCPIYALKNFSAKITLWPVGEPRSSFGQRIDLCPKCYEEFIHFMEGGVQE